MSQTLSPGASFAHYEIVHEIGHGGMGRVFKARDVLLDRLVALKVLTESFSSDEGFIQRFTREARVAARLNHPNIVQIYAFGKEKETWYLALELVDGGSVGDYISSGRLFAENEAIAVTRQAARALGVAHQAGIVHRDVKPDNLMMSSRGEIKLVDLGLAKSFDEDAALTAAGFAMGTPNYISPEQVRGEPVIDGRADIYSLGATLYHIAAGQTPYSAPSATLVALSHLTDPMPDPRQFRPELSGALVQVISKMVEKEREDRYQSMKDVEHDLDRLKQGLAPLLGGGSDEASVSFGPTLLPGKLGAQKSVRPGSSKVPAMAATAPTIPRAARPLPPTAPPPRVVADSGPADPILKSYERELARIIGPMARVLVKRHAKTSTSLEELAGKLAHELPESDRKAFLAALKKA